MIAHAAVPASPNPEAGFFGPASRPRFGWVHRPVRASGGALVIVPPFGYEAICAHRTLRALADAAARRGMVAVRFDLDGTGDSAGDDLDPARVESWLASIGDACDLARDAGAERIVLAGVRLGASLAAVAADARDDVAGLVAIAAVPSGRALMREARALQAQLGLAPAPRGVPPVAGGHELVGFALAEATRTALAQLDLLAALRAPAAAVAILDRDDRPANDAWAEALRARGAEVTHDRLPGCVEMLNDPHRAVVPCAIVDAAAAFAARATAGTRPQRTAATLAALGHWRSEVTLAATGTEITEKLVTIDDQVVALVTHPPAALATAPRRAVVMLNAGAIHHVGPNRLYVKLARRLAATGVLAVRVDLSGLGDSAPRPGAAENIVYGEHATRDIAATVAWVRAHGATEVAIVGLCSGAYHALKAAVAGVPIETIVPINPLTFFYTQGMPLDFAAFRVAEDTARYAGLLQTVGGWRKLARGDFDMSRAIHVLAERARTIAVHRARDVARQLHVPLRNDLGGELAALAARGVAMRFVFAGDDPGLALLEEQGGSVVRRLAARGALAIDVIDGADHTFTPRWSHAPLTDAIARAVLR